MKDDDNLPASEQEYTPDLLTLEDETGAQHMFEVLDSTDVEGVRYLAVVPYDEDPATHLEQDAEMILMRAFEDDFLDIVEDTEELRKIGQIFAERLSDIYDIDVDDEGVIQ